MYFDVIMAGFGGQGVMLIGNLLAYAAMNSGKNVTFFPSYGVEMRGGTANCTVVVSDEEIGSPIVGNPKSLIIMNKPSLDKFQPRLEKKGLLIFNSSLIDEKEINRNDIKVIKIPMNDLSMNISGSPRLANMIAIGAFVKLTEVVELNILKKSLSNVISERNQKFIPDNIKAIDFGYNNIQF
jgi:2-oxoglutarate ferredoxin oxidoreductase subunit gamma